MTFVQRLQGNFTITDPDWPIYSAWIPGQVWTSDTFSGDGELVGRQSDALLGGNPVRWLGTSGGWEIAGGQLAHLDPGAIAYFETPHQNYEAELTIVALPTAGSLSFVARRTDLNFTSLMEHLVFNVTASGYTMGQVRQDGSGTTIGDASGTQAGDILRLRVEGNRVRGWRNQEELFDYTGYIPSGQIAGISMSNAEGAAFDNFKITAL